MIVNQEEAEESVQIEGWCINKHIQANRNIQMTHTKPADDADIRSGSFFDQDVRWIRQQEDL